MIGVVGEVSGLHRYTLWVDINLCTMQAFIFTTIPFQTLSPNQPLHCLQALRKTNRARDGHRRPALACRGGYGWEGFEVSRKT